jgi:monofunctional biosynthetic peptidoglycan transglycosylase
VAQPQPPGFDKIKKTLMPIKPKLKKFLLWFFVLQLAIMAVLTLSLFLGLPDVSGLKEDNPVQTALMMLRLKQAEKKGTPLAISQEWVPFANIPQLLKDTVRIAEDANFYWHEGIDFDELKEAIKRNIRERKFARGASTITQQLAKNLYLSTSKSLLRKFKEYFIAQRLEKALTKNRIFELYLNIIELGPGIFGIQAASRHYFSHPVETLTLGEIVRLTAVIPRPLTADPRGESGWLR